jgi:DNA ligase D-like protein (predicted 3'-phosphoesterase)
VLSFDRLKKYKSRRNLTSSHEPAPQVQKSHKKDPLFVIQLHHASHVHYDFRLEINGVLVSWAVPKGPSLDPRERRLAVQTEDHPMGYASFEGIIPEGNYGAGTVLVWDTGTYQNSKMDGEKLVPMSTCLKLGIIEVNLFGKKLRGKYALVRTGSAHEKKWLLIKMRDEYADARRNPVSTQPESVLSGKTIQQIANKS